ncbi:MAG: hypothetical protein AB1758_38545, partial [Candidatus Eremiobacterota bacterium]
SWTPSGEGILPMGEFLQLGRSREADLLQQGLPSQAGQLRLVYQSLEALGVPTVEQAFDEMCRRADQGPDRKRWQQVLEVVQTSPEVLSLVESMASVKQLASAQNQGGSLEVTGDAVRIGSVVLKRKAQ